jgi:hypothetical protein
LEVLRFYKPQLYHAIQGDLPPEQWPQVVREMVGALQETRPPYKRDAAEVEAEAKRLVESAEPRARQYLLGHGEDKQRVRVMPPDQAVGAYLCREYRAAEEELWKSWTLPFPEAHAQMLRSWHDLAPGRPPAVDNPLIRANLVPASFGAPPDYRTPELFHARFDATRTDWNIAILRVIEALRDYAAGHDGLPPDRLDQVTDLPVPADPFTGRPFGYRREGRTATLDAPAPADIGPTAGHRYELTFSK